MLCDLFTTSGRWTVLNSTKAQWGGTSLEKAQSTCHVPDWDIVEFVVGDSGGEHAQLCLFLILWALSTQAARPKRGPAQINE